MVSYRDAERELVPLLEARTGTIRAGTAADPLEEARVLIGHVLRGRDLPADVTSAELSPAEHEEAVRLARLRAKSTPLALLTGREDFLGTDYETAEGVLVPHPATELLALVAVETAREFSSPQVVEIGHGAGQIAIETARRVGDAEITASEVSPRAQELLRRNAGRLLGGGAARITCVTAEDPRDVLGPFAGLMGRVDVLVSNPPFLSEIDPISTEVRNHTPDEALYGPDGDPMLFYRVIADDAGKLLSHDGVVVMEFHEFHRREVIRCFRRRSWTVDVVAREERENVPGGGKLRPMGPTGHRVLVARPSR
ncbi:N5-glutamine methyltransferase family protein [Streptomyces nitrosporeus]|uniref:N5-glutamine methyltransferase family protein n=1 Tax=Streptomyces nitrosporeus TaxID=28894 RepID=UPI0039A276EB